MRAGISGDSMNQSTFDAAAMADARPHVAARPHWRSGELRGIALLILLAALAAVFSCVYIYSKHLNGPPIRSDGYGYYAYLPSVFIDRDLEFDSALKNMPKGVTSFEVGINRVQGTGHYFDKYAVGTAVLQSPFFLGAHVLTGLKGQQQNGYTGIYQAANTLSAIFYLSIGMLFLYIALRTQYSKEISLAVVALSVFATNVFHYATYDASFSHVYQFALTSALLCALLRARMEPGRLHMRWACALGGITGLVALTRLTNITFALMPAALLMEYWWRNRDLKEFFVNALIMVACAFCVLFPQFLYFKATTGHWLVNAYRVVGEDAHFFWTSPEIANFLFSIRKGVFVWTPILIAGALGLPLLVKRFGLLGWSVVLVLCLQVYVCASWYCWWFGGSFGSRPMVDVMPLFALSLAGLMARFGSHRRPMLAGVAIVLVGLNLTLTYAYWRGFVPFDNADLGTLSSLPMRLVHGY
ncbi:MAG: hypothetical protein J0I96_10395 [Rhodanobacter sp.]|nr:hypothetical protein [Rhodanobacter sp.]